MKRIFQILLLLLPVCCYSQQEIIDSLERLLPTATTDSARYKLTRNIAANYSIANYDSALYYANHGLLLAQRNGKKLNEASVLGLKGFILHRLQRLTESYEALTTALQIAEDPRNKNSFWNTLKPQLKDKDYRLLILALIDNALAIFLQDVSRTDQAVFYYKKAIKFYGIIGDSLGIAVITSNLGVLYLKA